jgi:hypothetical protein
VTDIDEAELLRAARSGAVLNGKAEHGLKRALDAELLRRCCHQLKSEVDPRGLRLSGVAVGGQLDLAGLDVPFPLRFEDCDFAAALIVEGAELFELSITGCTLPGLLGNGLRLRRDLDLSRSRIAGAHRTSASTSREAAIWLSESEIGGRLLFVGSAVDGQGERAIQADRLRTGGNVRLMDGFTSSGEIRLLGARIAGSVDLSGVDVAAARGPAVDLAEASIDGSMFVIDDAEGRKSVLRGRLDLGGASISGRLVFRNVDLACGTDEAGYTESLPPGQAVHAPRITVGAEVILARDCRVTGSINMAMSEVGSVIIGAGCQVRAPGRSAINLSSAQVRSLVRLDQDALVEGTVRLGGAVIHGWLALHGTISQPENLSLVGATAATVDGAVYLENLRTDGGRVNLTGAVLGNVSAENAKLHNPGGYSLILSGAVVNGSVRLVAGFTSTGLLVLNRARIEGRLLLTGGSFRRPPGPGHGHAIEAISADVRGGMDLGWADVSPSVDFTDATTTYLADNPASWPERFNIAGLSYERFEVPQGSPPRPVWDHRARSAWLRRQEVFDSGPYEQAARVFRQHGALAARGPARPGHRVTLAAGRAAHAAGQQRQRPGLRHVRPGSGG